MDRERLHRGKRVDNQNEWIEGFYWKDIWGDNAELIIYDGDDYEVIPETVGEYTGLTDKNGKRIFEGDIVKTHYANANKTEFVELVVFEGGGFRAKSKYEDNSSHSAPLYNGIPHLAIDKSVYMDSIEVIGNIRDNPELLEAEELGRC